VLNGLQDQEKQKPMVFENGNVKASVGCGPRTSRDVYAVKRSRDLLLPSYPHFCASYEITRILLFAT
jgi:hypothetical protein